VRALDGLALRLVRLLQHRLKRSGIDDVLARQQGHAVDEVAQFAHVAAPGLAAQQFGSIGRQLAARQAFAGGKLEEMPRQRFDIVGRSRSGGRLIGTTLSR
jgi:hypothetical protein